MKKLFLFFALSGIFFSCEKQNEENLDNHERPKNQLSESIPYYSSFEDLEKDLEQIQEFIDERNEMLMNNYLQSGTDDKKTYIESDYNPWKNYTTLFNLKKELNNSEINLPYNQAIFHFYKGVYMDILPEKYLHVLNRFGMVQVNDTLYKYSHLGILKSHINDVASVDQISYSRESFIQFTNEHREVLINSANYKTSNCHTSGSGCSLKIHDFSTSYKVHYYPYIAQGSGNITFGVVVALWHWVGGVPSQIVPARYELQSNINNYFEIIGNKSGSTYHYFNQIPLVTPQLKYSNNGYGFTRTLNHAVINPEITSFMHYLQVQHPSPPNTPLTSFWMQWP